MIAHTHRLVGEFLYEQLPSSLKNKLNQHLFVNGNIKPDVVNKYRKMSHYYRDNEEFVFQIFERLMNEPMKKDNFSDLLGVLIHFLCDYTCIYHANDYIHKEHSIRLHMQYEIKFHLYAHRKFRFIKNIEIISFESIEEVRHYVKELVTKNNIPEIKPKVEDDFDEMVNLTVGVMFFILNNHVPFKS